MQHYVCACVDHSELYIRRKVRRGNNKLVANKLGKWSFLVELQVDYLDFYSLYNVLAF